MPFHPADGTIKWQYKTGGKIYASPLVIDDTVYFGSWDKNFYAVDLLTGKPKWKYAGADTFSISAVGQKGKIFIGNDDLKLYCLEAAAGKILWKTQLNSPVQLLASCPAIADTMLYIGSADANLYAIDTRNGAIKWKFKAQRPIIGSPIVTPHGVCVGSQDGNLYMVN